MISFLKLGIRLFFPLIATLIAVATSSASEMPSEEILNYKVLFKWGLIHKQAGRAQLVLSSNDDKCNAYMFARTEPWADRIYRVRDTLMTSFRYGALSPIEYHRIAHEGKRYAHDIISFYSQNDVVSANCVRHRKGKKDKAVNTSEIKLSAQGRTVDLLSSFYFIRSMEFKNLKKGEVIMLNIFSGKRKELLTIIFDGVETIKLNKKKIETYKVKFTFTSESKKQTSDPIIAWLSKEDGHIPLKLVGKLPIGQVQCIFFDACK